MSKDAKFAMWEYWRDDKGYETAMDDYYGKAFKEDPVLFLARLQYKQAKFLIDSRMAELTEEEENETI